MRTAARLSEDSSSDSLSSSTRTATHAPSSAGDGSYYYSYSSGSSSYNATTTEDSDASSVTSSTDADSEFAETATSDAASTFSAASGSTDREAAAAAPPASQVSAASSSVALVAAAPSSPDGKDEKAVKAALGAFVAKVVRTSTITSNTSDGSNGVTVDDADALVPVSSSSPLSSPKSLADPAAPASPYHFSEEELARQPWTVECDATTTHTSEENGGQLISRVPDALATIHTVPIAVPPPVEEAQRRRREGGLPFPSHLTFRIVPGAGGGAGESGGAAGSINADAAAQAKKAKEGKAKLDDDKRKHGLWTRFKRAVSKTWCATYFCGDKEELRRCAEERAEARQRSYHTQLRSHHVPLVNFRTTRDATKNLLDGDNTLPTVEEAAGYRQCVEDMTGAEAEPKQLHKAMRQRRRPASGLHWRTKYAYGRRAGGGPHGSGESVFVRQGEPQRFWIAQLHERSQVHLEQIETG